MPKKNVLVFSIAMNGYQWLYGSLRKTHERYAKQHNYHYVSVTQPHSSFLGMEIAWLKVSLILQGLEAGYDWVVFLDADTEVSLETPAVETLNKSGKFMYVAKGYSGRLNSGVLILKNHQCVANYFKKALFFSQRPVDDDSYVGWGENGHLIQFAKNAFFIEYIHQRWNNNFVVDLQDFIRHYSMGPLRSEFKPNIFRRFGFRMHFHSICLVKRIVMSSVKDSSNFTRALSHLTKKVVNRYPEFRCSALTGSKQELVSNG